MGTPEHGDSLTSVADGLTRVLAARGVERLVVTGNSAGGYAALVFGTLLGADTVLAFAPQTVLDLDLLAELGDHRWDQTVGKIVAAGSLDERWVDLRAALPDARRANTHYQVYFDESLLVDRRHAERLRGLPGVRLYRFGRGEHGLVRSLREAGALERMLRAALEVPGPPR
jgi:acetyl esterase/lipase